MGPANVLAKSMGIIAENSGPDQMKQQQDHCRECFVKYLKMTNLQVNSNWGPFAILLENYELSVFALHGRQLKLLTENFNITFLRKR